VIEAVELVKHFRAGDGSVVRAVDGVSLGVGPGEIVGLLGANGAGKTTTMRILATLLAPTAGTARIGGCDVRTDPLGARRLLGYVSASTGVPDRLTPAEVLRSYGRLHGLDGARLQGRIDLLLDVLDLRACADRPCGRLSSGQRQRTSLGRATSALDILGSRDLLDFLERLRGEGRAILLSTHRLHEIERRCDRFVVIHAGRVVAAGTRDALVADRPGGLEAAFFSAVAAAEAWSAAGGTGAA
jgi:sodium transport system ATP-binding protein